MAGYFPLCFSSEKQWLSWKSIARFIKPHPAHTYCEDCTAQFKLEMIKQDKCSHQKVRFSCDDDGLICGKRPITKGKK